MKYPVPPPTVAVMTGIETKKVLFIRQRSERWQSFERRAGLAEFTRRFVGFARPMVVVVPDFSRFEAKFQQTFVYVPLEGEDPPKTSWSSDELAFFRRCLDRVGRASATIDGPPQVACIAARYLAPGGGSWTASFAEIEHGLEFVSRQACADRIVPILAGGIGPDEGGLYAPYDGAGVFMLSSV
ncbi:MAG TPA: hypothetical protein VFF72_04720 [Caldimonas sp.]|nr:hypothetical protein [Caldimonas sp.]